MYKYLKAALAASFLTVSTSYAQDDSGPIVSAVLPSSRAVQVGDTATAFATIINSGQTEARNCGVTLTPGGEAAGTFAFQTTDANNIANGTPNTPVNIAGGGAQSFVFAFTPSAPYSGGDLPLVFDCDNTSPAAVTAGVNSFWMSASTVAGADIVAVSDTGSAVGLNTLPGVVETVDRQKNGAFVVAISNVGAAANLTARPALSQTGITVTPRICQTNQTTGACLAPAAASVDFFIGANQTASFSVFVEDGLPVAFLPGANRISVRFEEGGALRGSTSVAIRTLMSEPVLPQIPFLYADADVALPNYYLNGPVAGADNTPIDNHITNPGAALGRVLFYDRRLSANNTTSCASCHTQETGFSDPLELSRGFAGELTGRHSPGLSNARFYANGHFFWDERAATLEDQTLEPIQSTVEMGLTLEEAVSRIDGESFYDPLFIAAFGDAEVTSDRMALAMAQFVRSLTTYNSRFDDALAAGPVGSPAFEASFTEQEYLGLQLFMPVNGSNIENVGCAACHNTLAHISDDVHNIGLDAADDEDADAGNGLGEFKSPSLRNVAVRSHFMHDGRFTTLAEVIEHYNSGVILNPNLDPRLRAGGRQPLRLDLTTEEAQALEAFMHTLTDNDFLTDPRFADPFVD